MSMQLVKELESALAEVPVIDVHTHLVGGKLGARGLHDVLLYHMVVSDLYSAGCPSGGRLAQYPALPPPEGERPPIEEALPFLPHIQKTSFRWALHILPFRPHQWQPTI